MGLAMVVVGLRFFHRAFGRAGMNTILHTRHLSTVTIYSYVYALGRIHS
jgi:hypothetical protein